MVLGLFGPNFLLAVSSGGKGWDHLVLGLIIVVGLVVGIERKAFYIDVLPYGRGWNDNFEVCYLTETNDFVGLESRRGSSSKKAGGWSVDAPRGCH